MRSEQDRRIDAALLLYILGNASGAIKSSRIEQIVFLVELKLRGVGLTGPHYRFFRYLDGPYSQQLRDDLKRLADNGSIAKKTLALTERGKFLVELVVLPLREMIENRPIFETIDLTLKWAKGRSTDTLRRQILSMEIAPDESPECSSKLRDVPRFWTIVEPFGRELVATQEITRLLSDELTMTIGELRAARRRTPETERRMRQNLAATIKSDDQPSAQIQSH
jgi:uncharacterized protein YwgA